MTRLNRCWSLLCVGAASVATPALVRASTPRTSTPVAPALAVDRTADSLYRAGRESLARRDYHGAAELFERVVSQHPAAAVAERALYWRGYALYVAGNTTHALGDLRGATEALASEAERYPGSPDTRDAADLRARVVAAEAALGDPRATRALDSATAALAQPLSCDGGDLALAMVALEHVIDRDPEAAMPTVRRVLSTQGSCTGIVQRTTLAFVASTPGMNAAALVADLARAAHALTLVPADVPPIRQLGPIVASSPILGFIAEVRPLSDGRVLVHDAAGRRVVLFDTTLSRFTPVVDTTDGTAKAYGPDGGALFEFRGDSSLFLDEGSSALLVLNAAGKIVRTMAAPIGPCCGSFFLIYPAPGATYDGLGNLLRENHRQGVPFRMLDSVMAGPLPHSPVVDSAALLRIDLSTRRQDTIAFIRQTPVLRVVIERMASGTTNPFAERDAWTRLPDGTIAIVRAGDYHIDWLAPDGTMTSTPRIAHEWRHLTDSLKVALLDSARTADSLRLDSIYATLGGVEAVIKQRQAGAPRAQLSATAILSSLFPHMVPPDLVPDYAPAFPAMTLASTPFAVADADGNVWIRINVPYPPAGGPVYDIVNRRGMLVDRVQIPGATSIAAFGKGVAYLIAREGAGWQLARARIRVR